MIGFLEIVIVLIHSYLCLTFYRCENIEPFFNIELFFKID